MPAPYNPAAAGLEFPQYHPQVPPVVNFVPEQPAYTQMQPQNFGAPQMPPGPGYNYYPPSQPMMPPASMNYPLYDPSQQ